MRASPVPASAMTSESDPSRIGEPSTTGRSRPRRRVETPRSSDSAREQRTHPSRCAVTRDARAAVSCPRSYAPRDPATCRHGSCTEVASTCACSHAVRSPSLARRESCETAFGLCCSWGATARGGSPSTSVSHSTCCHDCGSVVNARCTRSCSIRSSTPSGMLELSASTVSTSSTATSRARRWRSITSLRTARIRYATKPRCGPPPRMMVLSTFKNASCAMSSHSCGPPRRRARRSASAW